ncbi:hypothetical protein C0Q70_04529 [Pomacea canaliculata]|uniref:FAD synthase n=1 Tax=Pomacea canaliculata TaxID=400727 RepID=A0A2T7PIL7_POMCA|nr:hypothetical protein C0Q70_04529 [Pomacea canaliculata]
MTSALDKRVTAGIIIVGDEILKGQTKDTNSYFICKRLFALGVQVKKISVVADDLEEIANEVADFSKRFTHVITSGGVGPTHDDMTFEGVAKAFGLETVPNQELVDLIRNYFGSDNLDSAKMKMAQVPSTARLQYGINKTMGKKTKYPLVSVGNVYMFPGVPSLLENAFVMLEDMFKDPDITLHTQELYVNCNETNIASDIQQVASKFQQSVVIGSYPDFHNSYYKVKLSLESTSQEDLNSAFKELTKLMPSGTIVEYEKDPIGTAAEHVYDIVLSAQDDSFHLSVREAVQVVEKALDKYRLDEICLGFNGGKDCTALLHLFHAIVQRKYPDNTNKLKALYIRSRQPFPEVELFVSMACQRYNLELIRYEGRIKENLASLAKGHPNIKAVLMGTRKTDPYSVVWKFLRMLSLPYCSLYDQGYTSLGSMNNTHPNPSLQYFDQNGIIAYKPAYELVEDSRERDGRNV